MKKLLVFLVVLALFIPSVSLHAQDGIDASDWAKENIQDLILFDFLPENLKGNYRDNIKRGEFAEFLVNLIIKSSGRSDLKSFISKVNGKYSDWDSGHHIDLDKNVFTDVSTEDLRGKYIVIANQLGIVNGKAADIFAPEDFIKRQESSKMLMKTFKILEKFARIEYNIDEKIEKYSDDNLIADWAKSDVYKLAIIKVMGGVGENKFDPLGTYTREQAYVTGYRLWKKIVEISLNN